MEVYFQNKNEIHIFYYNSHFFPPHNYELTPQIKFVFSPQNLKSQSYFLILSFWLISLEIWRYISHFWEKKSELQDIIQFDIHYQCFP